MSSIVKILPRRLMSRLIGRLVHWRGPRWFAHLTVFLFGRYYRIAFHEAEKDFRDYPSIGDFFIRKLKPETRPIGTAEILHPADSRITQHGIITNGQLIQAKGMTYELKDFTQDPDAYKKWANGYFITYYLCPTDYHRVHSPVSGQVTDVRHIPGDLWPVNDWSTNAINNLFGINERVLVEIETDYGPVGVMFVGATNVGSIELDFDPTLVTNKPGTLIFNHQKYEPTVQIRKGQELGLFRMGSTIVMLYPPQIREQLLKKIDLGPRVQVNVNLIVK